MSSPLSKITRTSALWKAVPYLALFGGMVSLAVGTSFAKQLFPVIGAEGTAALRVSLSALILLCIWRPWRFRLNRADAVRVLLYGLVLGLMNLTFYLSLRTIPLGPAIAIEFTGPLALALIHARRWIHFLWVGCAVAGLGLLLPLRGGIYALDPVGIAFAAAAGLFWALYIIFGKSLSHMHAGQSVALGMSTAAIVILPFGVMSAGTALLLPSVLFLGLGVALLSSALPYSLEMIALRHIPERTFGVMLSAEPAIGAVAGMVILHEQLSGLQWFAIGCIVIASIGALLTTESDNPIATPGAPA
ncbi:DMT family transporter [Sphingorhabdus sp. YGSMI21]|uniref:EamA family transporter n=1 Tax=Sphingorhabdus sp. YGSMI21 TaxID=2077182 RepID=UPI000C1EEE8E|nr:DMT family transporter [Sphingorhabdus sp. YGSMI21]ATW02683.1 EamA family transporter [Sphingorhabdus sp. YGSMI21]